MSRAEVILVVMSVLGSAIGFGIPLITLIWKAFSLIGEIRLQLSELQHSVVINRNQIDHLDQRWEVVTRQTIERLEHFSGRIKGQVEDLEEESREMQNFLQKTTSFEIRAR